MKPSPILYHFAGHITSNIHDCCLYGDLLFFPSLFHGGCQNGSIWRYNPTQPAHDEVHFPEKIHWSWRSGYQHPWKTARWMKLGTVVGDGWLIFYLNNVGNRFFGVGMLSSGWAWWYVVYLVRLKRCWSDGIPGSWKTVENHVPGWNIHHGLWMYFLLEKRGLFPANYVTSDVLLPNTM